MVLGMEVEKEAVDDGFCNSILSGLGENQKHLCAVMGAMSEELRNQRLPSSPVAYLGATCSSLDRIASESNPPNHLIDALLTILSLLLPRVPVVVLKKKREPLSELLVRVLRSPSVVSESAVVYGFKCLSHVLLINGDTHNLFNALLGFLTDSRPKVRRQSQLCLRDVLLNIQNSSLLLEEELLSLLAVSISSDKKNMSGDEMAFTARLLDAGINKLYSLNSELCVDKLPFVFNYVKDILASEHEEARYAATEALKNLINYCIDERLIKQGVDQITLEENKASKRSGPTIIEEICATISSLLDCRYSTVWDRVFQVVSAMFHRLGDYSTYFMTGILKNLENMQKQPDEDFPFRKQLHICLGSALVAMGPETFLSLIPLNLEAEDLSDANIWLFPILKQYIVGARLSYFTEEILPMIECIREKARKLERQGLIVSARNADALAYSLWSLLPSFCNYPMDTAKSLMDLQKHLCNKLKEEHDIRGIICTSLQLLIQQNNNIVDSNDKDNIGQDIAEVQVLVGCSQQVPIEKSASKNLLKDLSEVFLNSTKDDGGCLQHTIGYIASVANKPDVHNLFEEKKQKLDKCIQKANKIDCSNNSMQIDDASYTVSPSILREQFLDFAVSLLPGLDDKDIASLFQEIKPALQDVEDVMHKKAYKALSIILRSSNSFASSKFEELMDEILPLYHFSAKRHRLDCLYCLIVHIPKSKDNLGHLRKIVESFLDDIILALKEANKNTRNTAYDILIEIAHAYGDEERGGNKKNLNIFFNKVVGFLAGKKTSHMISAAAKGLASLAYEFSDLVLDALELFLSAFLPISTSNREIIKANLGFLKVLVVKSPAEGLQMHLGKMVAGLLKWQDHTKNHFKAKVKRLLGMLVTKCGLEAVKGVMPEEHMKLLSNICKMKDRKQRNRGAKSEETRSHLSKATTSRKSMWNYTNFFPDFDGGSDSSDVEYLNAKTISGGSKSNLHLKSAASSFRSNIRLEKNLLEQFGDEPLDLLDRQKTTSALRSAEGLKRKLSRLGDEVEIDSEGRLIIREEGVRKKEKPANPNFDIRNEPDGHSHLSGRCGTKAAQKRRKTSLSGWAYTGREYASKKAAGGDMNRKGKLEPYAYWPLDRKMMSRRQQQRAAARKGMTSVVKTTKKLQGKSASGVLSLKSLKLKGLKIKLQQGMKNQ